MSLEGQQGTDGYTHDPHSWQRHSRPKLSSHSSVRCIHAAFRSRPSLSPGGSALKPGSSCTSPSSVLLEQTNKTVLSRLPHPHSMTCCALSYGGACQQVPLTGLKPACVLLPRIPRTKWILENRCWLSPKPVELGMSGKKVEYQFEQNESPFCSKDIKNSFLNR